MSEVIMTKETTKQDLSDGKKKLKLPANVGTLPPGDDPFKDYLIDDWHFLEEVGGRSICPKCNKSRKYFCYTCYVPVTELTGKIPYVKLPIKIDIVKHSREIDGKSTASHAAVLAPDDVSIYTYPCIPDYEQDSGKVVLVFPGKNATSIGDYIKKLGSKEESSPPNSKRPRLTNSLPIERVVLIDSTWNQCRGIYKDSRLKGLPCVVLQDRLSQFWRHQEGSPRWYLATVEAVHQLLLELHTAVDLTKTETDQPDCTTELKLSEDFSTENKVEESSKPERAEASSSEAKSKAASECHDFDNLLFFFRFMYDKIHRLYEPETLRAYKRPLDL